MRAGARLLLLVFLDLRLDFQAPAIGDHAAATFTRIVKDEQLPLAVRIVASEDGKFLAPAGLRRGKRELVANTGVVWLKAAADERAGVRDGRGSLIIKRQGQLVGVGRYRRGRSSG